MTEYPVPSDPSPYPAEPGTVPRATLASRRLEVHESIERLDNAVAMLAERLNDALAPDSRINVSREALGEPAREDVVGATIKTIAEPSDVIRWADDVLDRIRAATARVEHLTRRCEL